ncbi:hypothetical protein V5G24_00130 [Xanthobacter sp. VTT E-85241]|uniref:hypothetical protein n=1 Tax=Roseixanthobacter finlandensis TaxID=3119922 RepID=UPI0037266E03
MTDLPTIPLSAIAKEVKEVAKLCGVPTADALVREFGGTRLWVPKIWRPDHDLNDIGEELARALFEYFGSSELSIPRTLFTARGRRDMIRRLNEAGHRQRDIARMLRCSQRVVRDEIGGRPRPVAANRRRVVDPRQIDLEEFLSAGK